MIKNMVMFCEFSCSDNYDRQYGVDVWDERSLLISGIRMHKTYLYKVWGRLAVGSNSFSCRVSLGWRKRKDDEFTHAYLITHQCYFLQN